jgi:hypothetical protein
LIGNQRNFENPTQSFCRISTGCESRTWILLALYSNLFWSYCVQSGHGRSIGNFHIFPYCPFSYVNLIITWLGILSVLPRKLTFRKRFKILAWYEVGQEFARTYCSLFFWDLLYSHSHNQCCVNFYDATAILKLYLVIAVLYLYFLVLFICNTPFGNCLQNGKNPSGKKQVAGRDPMFLGRCKVLNHCYLYGQFLWWMIRSCALFDSLLSLLLMHCF